MTHPGSGQQLPEEIGRVAREIVTLLSPVRIYLYNQRVHQGEGVSGFKLCVIAPFSNRNEAECAVYRQVDSEVPFDVLLYSPDEWRELTARKGSFAEKIQRTGTIVYE